MRDKNSNNVKSLRILLAIGLLSITSTANAGWELTWVDRFDGTGVNWDNWTAQTQANYNNEVQCYTDDESSPQRNYEVSDGTIKITARRMEIACPGLGGEQRPWTSGRLNGKDKAEFLYGRVEARLRFLNLEGGSWPAFWMLENRISEQPFKGDDDFVNWPNPGAGEIDVWEWYGNSGSSYITNFFNVGSCGGEFRPNYPGGVTDVTEFHTYAMEWTPDSVAFYMDDTLVVEHDMSSCSQYEEPMFVLINVAMGGNLGGAIDPNLNQATMEVDYVAHCARSTANSETGCDELTPALQDADGDGVSDSVDQCPNTPQGAVVDYDGCQIQTEPLVGAAAPAEPAENVISLYSDSYTNIASIDYNPDWGQATVVTEVDLDGNSVLKYEGLNYQGTDFDGNRQDVSDLAYFHVDYWTYNADLLSIYLISPGPVETPYNFPVQKQSWQRHKIPLSHFVNVDLTNTFQLKVEGNGDVYLDNIYFSGESQSNVAPIINLNAYQNGGTISEINPDDGNVSVSVSISDANSADSHSVEWQVSGAATFNEQSRSITISPSDISGDSVSITVSVTDNGSPALTTEGTLNLSVQETTPTPITPVTPAPDYSSSGGSMGAFLAVLLLFAGFRRVNIKEA